MKFSLGKGMNWLWLFPGIGAALLVGAAAIFVSGQRFEARALRAEGVVVRHVTSASDDGGSTYCPVVRFGDAEGRQTEFTGRLCSQPRADAVGDKVAVLYRADRPDDARIDAFMERWFAALVVGGIGGVFLLVGACIVVPMLRRRRTAAHLLTAGRPIQADVVEVVRDGSLKVNGRSPWRIHAQWQDPATRKLHLFESDMLWFDPTEFTGDRVTVLIEPGNPERYWIDTGFLPEVA